MAAPETELVQAWLLKAAHDLQSARRLSLGDDAPLDNAIYHCQQAAEKVVKAFLCHAGATIEKTHDVERLVKLAMSHEPRFAPWLDEAEIVTPYATRFRYPMGGVPLEPERTEYDEAFDAAQRLFDFVLTLLPPETHPI